MANPTCWKHKSITMVISNVTNTSTDCKTISITFPHLPHIEKMYLCIVENFPLCLRYARKNICVFFRFFGSKQVSLPLGYIYIYILFSLESSFLRIATPKVSRDLFEREREKAWYHISKVPGLFGLITWGYASAFAILNTFLVASGPKVVNKKFMSFNN